MQAPGLVPFVVFLFAFFSISFAADFDPFVEKHHTPFRILFFNQHTYNVDDKITPTFFFFLAPTTPQHAPPCTTLLDAEARPRARVAGRVPGGFAFFFFDTKNNNKM